MLTWFIFQALCGSNLFYIIITFDVYVCFTFGNQYRNVVTILQLLYNELYNASVYFLKLLYIE